MFRVQIKDIAGDWFDSVASDGRYIPLNFATKAAAELHIDKMTAKYKSWNMKMPQVRIRKSIESNAGLEPLARKDGK